MLLARLRSDPVRSWRFERSANDFELDLVFSWRLDQNITNWIIIYQKYLYCDSNIFSIKFIEKITHYP